MPELNGPRQAIKLRSEKEYSIPASRVHSSTQARGRVWLFHLTFLLSCRTMLCGQSLALGNATRAERKIQGLAGKTT